MPRLHSHPHTHGEREAFPPFCGESYEENYLHMQGERKVFRPSRVVQHEYDHIEGKVFTDHLSPLRRNLIRSKLLAMTKGKYRCAYKTK